MSQEFVNSIAVMNGIVKCPSCATIFPVHTPKGQGVKDFKRLKGRKASKKHKLIIKSFIGNPILALTINDIVLKVRRILYFSEGRATDLDKADLSRERAELFSWGIIELTGYKKGIAPYYWLTNPAKAQELLDGGVF